MGMLKNVWDDPHIDLHSKYLFFVAMPLNLLLWGCESWAIKKTSYKDLDVFIHQSIRGIIGINILRVKEEKTSNKKIRELFYNFPDAGSLIAMKQLNFIGKVVRKEDLFIPKQLLTAWVNNKRKCGGVLTTNRKSIVNALEHLYPANVYRTDKNGDLLKDSKGKKIPVTIHMDRLGSLKFWYKDALNKKRWSWMIESKIRSPHLKNPNPSSNASSSQPNTIPSERQPITTR